MTHDSGQRLVITSVFTAVAVIFIIRLFIVQVIKDEYKLSAENNVMRQIVDYPARGLVYDRNGVLLVYNEPVYDLMIIPRQAKNIDTAEFCSLIGITKEDFTEKFQKAKKFSPVKSSVFEKQLSVATYARLQEKLFKFNGFYVQPRTVRRYPYKIAAHTLGYIGEVDEKLVERNPYYRIGDYIGISGIEQSYEGQLRGKRGVRHVMVDVFNREKGSYADGKFDSLAVQGTSLTATLDAELQLYGEQLLQNKIGSIAAIEPKTGEILVLVSSPSYDPNLLVGRVRSSNYGMLLHDPLKPLFNRVMQAYYPPGSTFKLTSALCALQEEIISPHTIYPHVFTAGSKSVKCHPHPPVALEGAIQYSCNPYFCNVFRSFVDNRKFGTSKNGYSVWRNYMLSFGIGKKIGVDMPHELKGILTSTDYYDKIYGKGGWRATTIYSLGIGQGELGITPLQAANIMAIIANKGYYYTPHIIKKIGHAENSTRNLQEIHRVNIATEHFITVQDGMQKVVEAGTARVAQFGNMVICGKTGTAQNPHGKDHSVFVCFAPRDNPKIALAVTVENAGFGHAYAAPIASLMLEKYLSDSISRPELEKKMMEDVVMPDSVLKTEGRRQKPEDRRQEAAAGGSQVTSNQ